MVASVDTALLLFTLFVMFVYPKDRFVKGVTLDVDEAKIFHEEE